VGLAFIAPTALAACSNNNGTAGLSDDDADDDAKPPGQISERTLVLPYGDEAPQFGHLDLPTGSPPADGWPVAVVIHGGFWRAGYGLDLILDVARSLNADGWATWNIQYSSVGDPTGGWPGTFNDVAAGIDHLALIEDQPLDLSRVLAVGHSAGGHLALWAAGRPSMTDQTPGADPEVTLAGVVSLAGVPDLLACDRDRLGSGACRALLGVDREEDLDRYLSTSPIERLPTGVPTLLVHGDADLVVPATQSQRYVQRALEYGDDSTLIIVEGADHFDPIDPRHEAWQAVRENLPIAGP
jgi:acetyl esterase/lipase